MAWGDALKNLTASLSGVRLVLAHLQQESLQIPQPVTFFNRREVILSSMIVIMSGHFESFLRGFAEEFATALSAKGVPFTTLPEKIRETHFRSGGKVLAEISRPNRRRYAQSVNTDVARRLASVNQSPYELLWEAFADTQSNPNSDAVKSYLKAMAVAGGFSEVADMLNAKMPAQPHSGSALAQSLDALVARRNECAHSGASSTQLSEVLVDGYCDLLEQLAEGIADAVNKVVVAA